MLFDHLVGAREEQGREGETQSFRGLHIDHQLELGRPNEGQIGRLFALEYSARLDASLAVNLVDDWPVAHQSACFDKLTPWIYRG